MNALAQHLGRAHPPYQVGDSIPPAFHPILFNPTTPSCVMDSDEYSIDGVERWTTPGAAAYPKRMWGGSSIVYHEDVLVDEVLHRHETIERAQRKMGALGEMMVVTVLHRVTNAATQRPKSTESRQLLFLPPHRAGAASSIPPKRVQQRRQVKSRPAPYERAFITDERSLFEFSALTFNRHRIHYDKTYAATEGHPQLLVHGPLTSTLLLDHCCATKKDNCKVISFEYRAKHPLYCNEPFLLKCALPVMNTPHRAGIDDDSSRGESTVRVWAENSNGQCVMEGMVGLSATIDDAHR